MPTMLRLMLKYGLQQPAGTTKPRLEKCQGVADRDFSWRDDTGVDSDCLIQLANNVTNYRTIFWNVLSNTTRNHDATWARLQELNNSRTQLRSTALPGEFWMSSFIRCVNHDAGTESQNIYD